MNGLPVALPPRANLVFGKAEIVGGRVDRLCPLNTHHDHLSNGIPHAALSIERDHSVVKRPGVEDRCDALETVAFAHERIDDIYFDARVLSEISEGGRRSDVGEYEMVIVPHRGRALG